MELRPYQKTAVLRTMEAWERTDRALMVMPTGTGKTVVFSEIIHRLMDRNIISGKRPAVIIAHRQELLDQAGNKLASGNDMLRIAYEKAGSYAPRGSEVILASVATIGQERSRRLNWVDPSVVIIDECHHGVSPSYLRALARLKCFKKNLVKTLGVTATPKRFDKKALHTAEGEALFQEVAFTYTMMEAMQDGWLCPIRGYRVKTNVDLTGVKNTAGDFNQKELGDKIKNDPRTDAVISRWAEIAPNRRTLVFCIDVEHARQAAAKWRAAGIKAEHIDGSMGEVERAAILGRHRTGMTQVLTNCGIATEGYDDPEIDCIVMLRPTQSWSLYVQMAGRGTRLSPGKEDVIVLDVVDNTLKHNLATVPAILDLPCSLDLQGATLEMAAQKLKKVYESGKAKLLLSPETSPATLDEVDSLLERVEMLVSVEIPSEVKAITDNRWMSIPDGYLLSGASGKSIKLDTDMLGNWQATIYNDGKVTTSNAKTDDLKIAIQRVDHWVGAHWRKDKAILKGGKWESNKPSDKQMALMVQLGIKVDKIPGLTKGLAATLITAEFEKKKNERARQRT